MHRIARALVSFIVVLLLRFPDSTFAAPEEPCSTQGAQTPPIVIGHFAEGREDLISFCRYLVRHKIWPRFEDLGDPSDVQTAGRVQAALEGGTVHVLWLNPSAISALLSNSPIVLKIGAITDLPIVHVVSHDPRVELVTDSRFVQGLFMVREGASRFYADMLFQALGQPPRCQVGSGCTIGTTFPTFLTEAPSRIAIIDAPALEPSARHPMVLSLLHPIVSGRLVGIPPETIRQMRGAPGTVMTVVIPAGRYGLRSNPNVPADPVSTAAAPIFLAGGTPPGVAELVDDLVIRINDALFRTEPRVSLENVRRVLLLLRTLNETVGGRIILYERYALILRRQRIEPIIAIPSPSPTRPSGSASPQPPEPPGGPPPGVVPCTVRCP